MSRKKIGLIICCILAFSISGCGNAIPEMTEEQNSLITEYAAGLLLRYSTSYESRLVDTSVAPEEEQKTLADAEQINGGADQNKNNGEDTSTQEGQSEGSGEEAITKPTLTIAQVLGLSNVDVSYIGFEICDMYPDISGAEDPAFVMKAQPGNKLVILNLQVMNSGTEPTNFDTIDLKPRFRVLLNGENKKNVLLTMLENDFSAMNTTLEAGASMNTVLVTEISEDITSSLSTVALEVKMEDSKTIIENP